eukprot:UN07667
MVDKWSGAHEVTDEILKDLKEHCDSSYCVDLVIGFLQGQMHAKSSVSHEGERLMYLRVKKHLDHLLTSKSAESTQLASDDVTDYLAMSFHSKLHSS